MTGTAATAAPQSLEDALQSPFVRTLLTVVRAHKSSRDGAGDLQQLESYLFPGGKRVAGASCAADPAATARLEWFYSAVAREVERRSGIPGSFIMMMSREIFGRVQVTAGRLVVANVYLRDVNAFGFVSPAALAAEGERLVDEALGWIAGFPEVARS